MLVILEGPVHLLDVSKDHLRIKPARADHVIHVVAGNKIRDACKPLSGLEGELVVGLAVLRRQAGVVKCLGEEVVDEGAEAETVRPRGRKVGDFHVVVLPCPALAPDEDGFHLRGHHLGAATRRSI